MQIIFLAIVLTTGVFLLLAGVLLVAERLLADFGNCRVSINEGAIVFDQAGGMTLLEALYEHDVFVPSACGGKGTCGYCKVRVLAGGGDVLPTETPYLKRAELRNGMRLACQVKVRSDMQIVLPADLLNAREFRARVTEARMLTQDIRELNLELLDPFEIDHHPGQYVQVLVPGHEEPVYRAYSISSAAFERSKVQLHVRRVSGGTASTYLHAITAGDDVVFTGPYGEFRLSDDPDTEIICVGGGCGMAPMANIIESLYRRWPDRACRLFFGCRTVEDVYYRDRWEHLSRKHPAFRVVYAVSEKPADGHPWDGDVGFIHLSVAKWIQPGVKRQAFLCGPEAMIEAVTGVLLERGIDAADIFHDAF